MRPTATDHLAKATNNKNLAKALGRRTPTETGWALTMLFYSALHFIDAFHAKHNFRCNGHVERNAEVQKNPQLMPIADEYRDLSTYGWNARYWTNNYGEKDFQDGCECLAAIEKHIRGLL